MDTNATTEARKRAIRKQYRAARGSLPLSSRLEADGVVAKRVFSLEAYQAADVLVAYASRGSEVSTTPIIEHAWSAGKRVCLPRVVQGTHELRWHEVRRFSQLQEGVFGILEPSPDACPEFDPCTFENSLALIPGLIFDKRGYRLGYGGGFYDTFLARFRGASVGLCRRGFHVEDLGAMGLLEQHDLAVDVVITD